MSYIVEQQISNHPLFSDVERTVRVHLQMANSNAKIFEFHFDVKYEKNAEDVSGDFTQKVTSIRTDDKTKLLKRDENNQPIPNPEWDGESEDEYDKFLWDYGWDKIIELINQETKIADLLRFYILINDSEGYFD